MVDEVIAKIRVDPFLKFMEEQIRRFLDNIFHSLKEDQRIGACFLTISGVSGSGKTNFVYEYLKDYLLCVEMIKKNQSDIDKIAYHDLTDIGLRGQKIENVIEGKEVSFKDGILILDEFNIKDKNSPLIVELIKRLHSNVEYKYSVVILMGEYINNSSFIKEFNLENIFKPEFRLNFFTPYPLQIADMFEGYGKRDGDYSVTEKAKSSLTYYFSQVKIIKEIKSNLHRQGILNAKYRERNYTFTSEMFPIYKEIISLKVNDKLIDEPDIINSNEYKKMLSDLNQLKEYIGNKA